VPVPPSSVEIVLATLPVFRGLSDEDRCRIAAVGRMQRFAKGGDRGAWTGPAKAGRSGAVGALLRETSSDAPACRDCGAIMIRTGACYGCTSCGATSGCG
jgi:hypothetical protein